MTPLQQYLSILFNPGDYCRVGNRYDQSRAEIVKVGHTPIAASILSPSLDGIFVTLNPICMHENRVVCGVQGEMIFHWDETIPQNILLEIDDGSTIEDQLLYFKLHGVPWSTMVFSGNRSVHLVIAMTEPFESLHQYRQYCYAVHRALGKKTDPNPSYKATTKLPGFRRNKGQMREQTLLGLNRKVTRKELNSFLIKMGQYHWTQLPPKEFEGNGRPNKVNDWIEGQYYRSSGNSYGNCECPSCGGSKMWFALEGGSYGCWHGCSRQEILNSLK